MASTEVSERMPTYLEIHLRYTLPPCLLLFLIHRPLLQKRDTFRFILLAVIAVVATIPWDSYLIRTGVWTYPEGVVWGTLWDIPVEEIAFFVIQTYLTTQLYALLNKSTPHASHLPPTPRRGVLGSALLLTLSVLGALLFLQSGRATYLGLILVWACPVLAGLWYIAGPHAMRLPLTGSVLPVVLTTAYLWGVDTYALRRGVWAIGGGTKLGWEVWRGLEFEEALFFLISNSLLTLGSIAFSHAFALADVYSLSTSLSPSPASQIPADPLAHPLRTIVCLYKAVTLSGERYPGTTVRELGEAARTLRKHSKSFSLASSVFGERCRLLLLSYYAFCRVTDDLVDDAKTEQEAKESVRTIERFLGMCYPGYEYTPVSVSESKTQGRENEIEPRNGKANGNGHSHLVDGKKVESVHEQGEEDDGQGVPLLPSHDSGYADCWPSPNPSSTPPRPKYAITDSSRREELEALIESLPQKLRPAFSLFRLLTPYLPPEPVYDLLKGYEFDALAFPPPSPLSSSNSSPQDQAEKRANGQKPQKDPRAPIETEDDLILYCRRVAGSVGVACTHLMRAASSDTPTSPSSPFTTGAQQKEGVDQWVLDSASDMGVALQLVNIARDIVTDAEMGRSYIPSSWSSLSPSISLPSSSASVQDLTTPGGILARPEEAIAIFRPKLLKLAFAYFARSAPALDYLPSESKVGARAAVAAYMAMGVLMRSGWFSRKGKWSMLVKVGVVGLVLWGPGWGWWGSGRRARRVGVPTLGS